MYRGIAAPILVEAPKRATKFAANEQYTALMLKYNGQSRLNQWQSIVTGMMSGMTEACVVVSFELVKVRMQDAASAGRYSGTMDCVLKILKEEGPLAFFRGLEATLWRHAAWNGGYFGVIHGVKEQLKTLHVSTDETKPSGNTVLMDNLIAGTIGGTVGTILNTPFDVAKTRIQNSSAIFGASPPYTLTMLKQIAQNEGFSALYKGFLPKVLRLGPGGGILLVVFERVTLLMKQYL